MENNYKKFGGWFQFIDKFSRKNILVQISWLIAIAIALLLLFSALWCCFSNNISLFDLFIQSINPSSTTVIGEHLNVGQQILTIPLFLLTSLIITGLVISMLVSWFDKRHEKWVQGDINYNINKNFVLIIGGHNMVANLCKQLIEQETPPNHIVIQTKRVAYSLRKEIESKYQAQKRTKELSKIIIYNGDRCSESDLERLNADMANEIFIIGENKDIDGHDHDTSNLQCFRYIADIFKNSERRSTEHKIPCHVMFSYQSSFHVFQFTDVSMDNFGIDFIPFNIYRITAQQVLVNNEIGDQKYKPLDCKGITDDSEQFVHLIVVGMSKMGTALAVEAAHLCHFPNFIKQDSHPRTLITFIERNGKQEMDFFKGRYRSLFQLARSRYVNKDDCEQKDRIYDQQRNTFADPLRDGTSVFAQSDLGENFIDIDWEFIDGDISCPSIQQYLVDSANDQNAITTIALCLPITVEAISAALYMPEDVYRSNNITQILVEQTTNNSIIKALREQIIDNGDLIFTKLCPFGMFSECDYLKLALNKLPQFVEYTYKKGNPKTNENVLAPLFDNDVLRFDEVENEWNKINSNNGKSIIAKKISDYCFAEMIEVKQRSFNLKSGNDILNENIDLIANVEHNRWNIEQLLIGYRPPLKDEIEIINAKINNNGSKNKEVYTKEKAEFKRKHRVHFDLRAYNKMKEISKEYKEEFPSYQYDELLSAHLPVLLKIMEYLKNIDKIEKHK